MAGPLVSVAHFRSGEPGFADRAADALTVLSERDGFLGGDLARSTDDIADWVLVTRWRDVGSYRRALGNYEVKLRAMPLLGEALDQPSSFETVLEAGPDEPPRVYRSDRAAEPRIVP
jgi:heme oxygenase (mycobilin-producing)